FVTAASFLNQARSIFAESGIEVQTTRVAGADLAPLCGQIDLGAWAGQVEATAREAGVEYLSFGRLPVAAHAIVAEQMAPILAAGEIGFFSADLIDGKLPSVAMA